MGTTDMTTGARIGAVLPCAPATVPAARPEVRRRQPEVLPLAVHTLRTWGDVSLQGETDTTAAITGPTFDADKSTGASVPGRRGGT